jgi:hypothetical protein
MTFNEQVAIPVESEWVYVKVKAGTELYAYRQGGLSGAIYLCDKADADYMLVRVGEGTE